jgi:TFIIF-interacting CTD phosphatase-like protein
LLHGLYVKDLKILKRNLSKVVIVDNIPESYALQPENGIEIKPWYGNDDSDRELKYLYNRL